MTSSPVTIALYCEKAKRVKAVRFDAINDDGSHVATIVGWANGNAPKHQHVWSDDTRIYLEDLDEGRDVLKVGDWLLLHEDGRLAAMQAQFFEIDYEPVPSAEASS